MGRDANRRARRQGRAPRAPWRGLPEVVCRGSRVFAAREFAGLDDLNEQARPRCEGQASDRRWPEDSASSVREAFEAERASLLALPEREFALGERLAVEVGKTPYVRFDLNDYTVPHTHARRTLAVLADDRRVRVFDGIQEVASHVRSYDSGRQICRAGRTASSWSPRSGESTASAAGP